MFPLNDTEPNRYGGQWPLMTLAIIAVNTLIWLAEAVFGGQWLIDYYLGSVPALILNQMGGGALSSLTSTFLHANFAHLAFNMLALWVFGRRVEDACGGWRFLGFYLTAGLCADILSTLLRYGSRIPSIGASGAIFGVMGAYLLLFPGGRIRTFLMLWIVPTFPKIRAFWIVAYFVITQFISVADLLFHGVSDNVNYWAHLGGFFSCFCVFFFLRPEAFERYCNDTPV